MFINGEKKIVHQWWLAAINGTPSEEQIHNPTAIIESLISTGYEM